MTLFAPIIPVRDQHDANDPGRSCLEVTLDAVLAQTARPMTVIVADYGSQDGTLDCVAQYQAVTSHSTELVEIKVIIAPTRLSAITSAALLQSSAVYSVIEPGESPQARMGEYLTHAIEAEGPLALAETTDGEMVGITGDGYSVISCDLGRADRAEIAAVATSRALPVVRIPPLSEVDAGGGHSHP